MLLLFSALAWGGAYEDGVAALKAGRAAEAKGLLQTATEAHPENAEAWWELGWAAWATDDFAGAVRAWENVERLNPTRAELNHWLEAARARVALAETGGSEPAPVPLEASEGRIRFVAAGDTMMGSDLKKGAAGLAPGDGEEIFAPTRELFKAADVAFVNLEGPLADGLPSTKCGPTSTHCYAFRTPTRYAKALAYAGIDVASLANNHAMDLGSAGQTSTMATLDALGIAHAGRYGDVAHLEVDGVHIAVVAAHTGECCLNINQPEAVANAIRLADRDADLVVLSFHGGAEGTAHAHVPGTLERAYGEKRGDVRKVARMAVDAGADLVIGHGPHVLRAMEVYRGRLIAYSLGNFSGYKQFGRSGGPLGTTVLLDVELAHNGVLVGGQLHPLALDGNSVPRPDPEGAGLDQVRALSAEDFPETGVRVSAEGALSWGVEQPADEGG